MQSRGQLARVASAAMAVACALLLLAALVFSVTAHRHGAPAYPVWFETTVNGVAFSVVALVLTRRRPENPVSWLFGTLALLASAQLAAGSWAEVAFVEQLPGGAAAAFAASVVASGSVIAIVALLLALFPDGRPATPRWAWLVPAPLLLAALTVTALALSTRPYDDYPGHRSPFATTATIGSVLAHLSDGLSFIVLVGAIASVVVRWRVSTGERRQQLKPFLLAAALWPVAFVLILLTPLGRTEIWPHVIFGLTIAGLTAGAAVSVLRYRLYDIDRVVSRTLAYVVVTALLVGVYVGAVTLMTEALSFSSAFGTAAATLSAAALFHPLRRRVQTTIDRRFNRAKYDALSTVDAFASRLRDEVDVDIVRRDLVGVVARSVEPAHVSLWAPASH